MSSLALCHLKKVLWRPQSRGLCLVSRSLEWTQQLSQPHILHPERSLVYLHPFLLPGWGSGEAGGWLGHLGTFPWQMPPAGASLFREWDPRVLVPLEGRAWVGGMHCWDVP